MHSWSSPGRLTFTSILFLALHLYLLGYLALTLLELISFTNEDFVWRTEKIQYGTKEFIEYHPGNMNLIVTIPHGGSLRPKYMKNRRKKYYQLEENSSKHQQVSVTSDTETLDLGFTLIDELVTLTGRQPHVILSRLHRRKVDMNRSPDIGICPDDELSELAYKEYHSFISKAAKKIDGNGLLIDLHGHSHAQKHVELGYLLFKSDLNAKKYRKRSSIRNLQKRSGESLDSLLFGNLSLGSLLEQAGYMAVPSSRQKLPGEDKYFSGGYTIKKHGSRVSGQIDAIQVEVPDNIRNDLTKREPFARVLAEVLTRFMKHFYQKK